MKIIGAGMSGLIAGQYFRSECPIILEQQEKLPNNQKALLRFRTNLVQEMTGIPFRKVTVHKAISYRGDTNISPISMGNLYSQKIGAGIRNRSLSDKTVERYIAPEDFVRKVANGLDIRYGADATQLILNQMEENSDPIISTIPVSTLAEILGYDIKMDVMVFPIWTITFNVKGMGCDIYQTIYYPGKDDMPYRISITGEKVIVEFCFNPNSSYTTTKVMNTIKKHLKLDFGMVPLFELDPVTSHQRYGKLVSNGDAVKDFISWSTTNFNIYSLGRWATHRQILMDDVANDIKVIGKMIETNNYSR